MSRDLGYYDPFLLAIHQASLGLFISQNSPSMSASSAKSDSKLFCSARYCDATESNHAVRWVGGRVASRVGRRPRKSNRRGRGRNLNQVFTSTPKSKTKFYRSLGASGKWVHIDDGIFSPVRNLPGPQTCTLPYNLTGTDRHLPRPPTPTLHTLPRDVDQRRLNLFSYHCPSSKWR